MQNTITFTDLNSHQKITLHKNDLTNKKTLLNENAYEIAESGFDPETGKAKFSCWTFSVSKYVVGQRNFKKILDFVSK